MVIQKGVPFSQKDEHPDTFHPSFIGTVPSVVIIPLTYKFVLSILPSAKRKLLSTNVKS
jgi:hypothetical protein